VLLKLCSEIVNTYYSSVIKVSQILWCRVIWSLCIWNCCWGSGWFV